MTENEIKRDIISNMYSNNRCLNKVLEYMINNISNIHSDVDNIRSECWLLMINYLNKFKLDTPESNTINLWIRIRDNFNTKSNDLEVEAHKSRIYAYLSKGINNKFKKKQITLVFSDYLDVPEEENTEKISCAYLEYIRTSLKSILSPRQAEFIDYLIDGSNNPVFNSKQYRYGLLKVIQKKVLKAMTKIKLTDFHKIKLTKSIREFMINTELEWDSNAVKDFIIKNIDKDFSTYILYDTMEYKERRYIVEAYKDNTKTIPLPVLLEYYKLLVNLFKDSEGDK